MDTDLYKGTEFKSRGHQRLRRQMLLSSFVLFSVKTNLLPVNSQWHKMLSTEFQTDTNIDNHSQQQPHKTRKQRKTLSSSAQNWGYVNHPVWTLWGQNTATTKALFFCSRLRLKWLISVFVIVNVTQQIKTRSKQLEATKREEWWFPMRGKSLFLQVYLRFTANLKE